ncbi:inositol monophosphatase family protein [Pelagicoccus sp. SDUM812002]|uniref:inositol monophosphatase family protein n=1 Tax=Pelagicoccus sp. SDUM812002 TaxID=3041266 RepID=UPI0028103396|nr:inositol monophosphatase family protein [Pelagicoccus sp. SDUM812002]MDQ8188326.1 inositol monophosphatase family protein [Pelagicoccus sp. SDUM812002]
MNLSARDLKGLRDLSMNAAREAGRIVQDAAGRGLRVERKRAGESLASQVVTEVDRLAEDCILEVLGPSIREFGFGVLTEERKDDGSRFAAPAFWCIDPLDGTLPFAEGVAGYAVSIALVTKGGAPLLGAVFDPLRETLFDAIRGLGARIDGTAYRLPEIEERATALPVFSDRSSLDDPRYGEVLASLEKAFGEVLNTTGYGAALNACSILERGGGCYFKLPKQKVGGGSVWDFAASSCIFREAGGVASDVFGEDLALNPRGSLFMNGRGVLFASDPAVARWICKNCTNRLDLRD